MDSRQIFAMQVVIAIVLTGLIYLPITIYKNWKHRKEGKTFTIKYLLLIALPIMSLPFLFTNLLRWYEKVFVIFVMGLYPVAYVLGIRQARNALRKILGLPPVDNAGNIIKKEEEEEEEEMNRREG